MLKRIIESCGLSQANWDLGCFYNDKVIIEAYVDDLLTIRIKEDIDRIEEEIKKHVKLDIRGIPMKMLGIEMTLEEKEVLLTQRGLMETLRIQYGIARTKMLLPLNP